MLRLIKWSPNSKPPLSFEINTCVSVDVSVNCAFKSFYSNVIIPIFFSFDIGQSDQATPGWTIEQLKFVIFLYNENFSPIFLYAVFQAYSACKWFNHHYSFIPRTPWWVWLLRGMWRVICCLCALFKSRIQPLSSTLSLFWHNNQIKTTGRFPVCLPSVCVWVCLSLCRYLSLL